MIDTSDFKNGIAIVVDNILYQIIEFQHIKPGKGGAFVRTKLKNLRNKSVIDKTFRAGEKVEDAFIEYKNLQYTYNSGSVYHFMDTETYEEINIQTDSIGKKTDYLKEGMEINASYHKSTIVDINLPTSIELKITHTEPGIKGDTVGSSFKPATVETGAVIQVPLFINQGDIIKVDTRTGGYLGRV
ncbi:MAG: elongation factor P [Candidatus Omnitrophota bacterium]